MGQEAWKSQLPGLGIDRRQMSKSDTVYTSYYFGFGGGINQAEANHNAKTAVSDIRLQCRGEAGRESFEHKRRCARPVRDGTSGPGGLGSRLHRSNGNCP